MRTRARSGLVVAALGVALAGGALVAGEPAAPASTPIALSADELVWKGAPSVPNGATSAVLEGDPSKPGMVTLRLKVAKGTKIGVHTHPADERVTVLSGALRIAWADQAGVVDDKTARRFGAGGFYLTPKGTRHALWFDEDTQIQITVQGPWGIDYADAADDPRKKR